VTRHSHLFARTEDETYSLKGFEWRQKAAWLWYVHDKEQLCRLEVLNQHTGKRRSKNTMLRNRVNWIVLIVVALAAGGGYYYYENVYDQPTEAVEETIRTTRVRRGDLVISASGSGELIPADDVDLGFTTSGVLTEVLVKVGDYVQAGDVLARLDITEARRAVATAELRVAQAEATLASQQDPVAAQRTLDLAEIQVAQAEINLASAQLKLDDLLEWTPDEDAIAMARANLEAAQASYEATANRSISDQMTSVRIGLEQAQSSLSDAQEAYYTAWDPARDWELYDRMRSSRLEAERESATRNLERAQQNLEIAQANYNLAWANIDDTSKLNAWTQVLNAQASLEDAQTGPSDSDIETTRLSVQQAELSLRQAQINLEEAQLGVDTTQAELSLAQAQLDLEAAQEKLDQLSLVAPINGLVTAVDAQVGQTAGTSPIVTLANLDQSLVELYLDETDLDKIAVGNEVEVVFDALPDDVFAGRIVRIEPALVTVEGVPTVQAVAVLEGVTLEDLPAGLNASVDVIGGKAENALLVTVEALRELGPGQYAVFVVKADGELEMRPVEVGLIDFANAEIISGLQLGDEVSTGIVETN
jgi:RND family efflux transporter MFP subunit